MVCKFNKAMSHVCYRIKKILKYLNLKKFKAFSSRLIIFVF